jgi:hypothetical protein
LPLSSSSCQVRELAEEEVNWTMVLLFLAGYHIILRFALGKCRGREVE